MTVDAPLSLESAVASLLSPEPVADAAPPGKEAAPAGANAAVEGADAQDEDKSSGAAESDAPAEASGEDPAASAQDTPADQGETTDEGKDQGDALPPIEAPSSWSTEEKAEWNSLSRKAQETIQRREQDNARALRNAQNSAAEQRKTAEAEVNRLKGLAQQIENVVNRDIADLAKDFPEIKTEADVAALAQTDPARFAAFQGRLMALNAGREAQAQAAAEAAKVDQTKETERLAEAKKALLDAFPGWSDPEVARREVTELQDYAIKMGAPEAAARGNLDPVVFKLTQKAMLYDKALAAKQKAVDRTPPRVVKPGAKSDPKVTAREEARRNTWAQYEKSGDLEDAAKLLLLP